MGAYCRTSGEVAQCVECGICSGKVVVKGGGVLPEADLYGVAYVRGCRYVVVGMQMRVALVDGSSTIAGCRPVPADGGKSGVSELEE